MYYSIEGIVNEIVVCTVERRYRGNASSDHLKSKRNHLDSGHSPKLGRFGYKGGHKFCI